MSFIKNTILGFEPSARSNEQKENKNQKEDFALPWEDRTKKNEPTVEVKNRRLTLKWINFNLYVALPVSFIISVVGLVGSIAEESIVGLIASVATMFIFYFLFQGLYKFKTWGWSLAVFTFCFLAPLGYLGRAVEYGVEERLDNFTGSLVIAVGLLMGGTYGYLNWIYFKKRKHLFNK